MKKRKKMLDVHRCFAYVGGCRALVAQLDRATGYEPVGREFESLRAHHFDVRKACRKRQAFFVCFIHYEKRRKKRLTFSARTTNVLFHQALVAQLDRATGYEPVGREFESLRAHHSRAKAYEDNLISLFSYSLPTMPDGYLFPVFLIRPASLLPPRIMLHCIPESKDVPVRRMLFSGKCTSTCKTIMQAAPLPFR